MKKLPKIEITELFMAKADWHRTFVGTLTRDRYEDGSEDIYAEIPVNDYIINATAPNKKELGKKLDDIVILILDHNIMEMEEKAMFPTKLADKYGIDPIIKFNLNQVKDFELLKRTYPVSQFRRYCDGYKYILNNSTEEERKEWGIKEKDLQRVINEGEKYIYQVAKEGKEFKIMCLCFKNYEIIRKKIFKFEDE